MPSEESTADIDHVKPDPTNGIVVIPTALSGGDVYHTRMCSHYPGKPRRRRMTHLMNRRPCKHCTRQVEYHPWNNTITCPGCGDDVQPHRHLPCAEYE